MKFCSILTSGLLVLVLAISVVARPSYDYDPVESIEDTDYETVEDHGSEGQGRLFIILHQDDLEDNEYNDEQERGFVSNESDYDFEVDHIRRYKYNDRSQDSNEDTESEETYLKPWQWSAKENRFNSFDPNVEEIAEDEEELAEDTAKDSDKEQLAEDTPEQAPIEEASEEPEVIEDVEPTNAESFSKEVENQEQINNETDAKSSVAEEKVDEKNGETSQEPEKNRDSEKNKVNLCKTEATETGTSAMESGRVAGLPKEDMPPTTVIVFGEPRGAFNFHKLKHKAKRVLKRVQHKYNGFFRRTDLGYLG